ncbi:hypothetical protein JCM8547_004778 [Rhodosporidiobolus lusitaniae]
MSNLHPNPALHHQSAHSSHSPSHPSHHPAFPSESSSSGYDGETLAPSYTAESGGGVQAQGGGCLAEEDDGEGDDVRESKQAGETEHREDSPAGRREGNDDELLHAPEVSERPGMSPRSSSDRLRRVAQALEAANILSLSPSGDWDTRPPGIDPHRVDIPDLKCRCVMQVADWNADRVEFSVVTNKDGQEELKSFLEKGRPEFAKVRWIHVNGLSWDVIKPLALHYDLHPLSLEDMLHHGSSSSTRSKVDYFKNHLFVSLIVHRTLEQPAFDVDVPEEVFGPGGLGRSTTKALKKGKVGSKDRSGHFGGQFGFHHHRRDEEAIVESSTSLPSSFPSGPAVSASTSAGAGSYLATPIPTGGSSTPLPGTGLEPGRALNPKSYGQYTKTLREAFRGVKAQKEETARTLSHNRSGLSTRFRARATGKGRKRQMEKLQKDEDERLAARMTVAQLTKEIKVHIHVEQLGIFLFRDGTCLSFTQDAGYHRQISALFERLQSRDDLLRDSEDASFVLQSLLDVTADDALDVVDEFREQLTRLESKVLSRADMEDVRHLHILSSQLLLLKSTLTPLQLLLQSLRAQDDAKAAAAFRLDPATRPNSPSMNAHGGGGSREKDSGGGISGGQRKGFVSHEAKIYLGDVMDHVDSVLSSLELFGELSENLIAFVFNAMSYSSNSYMQALSVISLVFLPATFLSSYFGMNLGVSFTSSYHLWRTTGNFVDELDVDKFWSIALPISIAVVIIFGWEYLAMVARAMRRNALRIYHKAKVVEELVLSAADAHTNLIDKTICKVAEAGPTGTEIELKRLNKKYKKMDTPSLTCHQGYVPNITLFFTPVLLSSF